MKRSKPIPRFLRAGRSPETRGASLGAVLGSAVNVSGIAVTERSALTLTAAYAAINVIATDTACLPIRLYKTRKSGGRDQVDDRASVDCLKWSPDGVTTAMRSRQAWMGHTLGWGNGYLEVIRDGGGDPIQFKWVDPSCCQPRRRSDGQVYYQIDGRTQLPENVLHLAGLGFDGLCGYSPVRMARQAIGLGLAAETFGASLFGNGSTPRGFLKSPKRLTAEAARRMREGIERVHAGAANANRLAVLEEGTDWVQTSMSPEDSQFLATRQFQVVEVARIYRLPPHKIGDYSQSHLANIEAANLDYLTTTLAPWCEAMEQELNLKLLTTVDRRAGYYFEHVLTAILRGDMKARTEFYTKLRDLGVLTPNMICDFENLNPIGPSGDIRLVPLNMTTLDRAGQPTPTPTDGKSRRAETEERNHGTA